MRLPTVRQRSAPRSKDDDASKSSSGKGVSFFDRSLRSLCTVRGCCVLLVGAALAIVGLLELLVAARVKLSIAPLLADSSDRSVSASASTSAPRGNAVAGEASVVDAFTPRQLARRNVRRFERWTLRDRLNRLEKMVGARSQWLKDPHRFRRKMCKCDDVVWPHEAKSAHVKRLDGDVICVDALPGAFILFYSIL